LDVITFANLRKTAPRGLFKVNLPIRQAQALLQNKEIRAKFPPLGLDPAASTPAEFTEIVKSELAKWTRVIKDANIKAN